MDNQQEQVLDSSREQKHEILPLLDFFHYLFHFKTIQVITFFDFFEHHCSTTHSAPQGQK